ncbi:hypothetical protein D3C76_731070 [compost metagenome]
MARMGIGHLPADHVVVDGAAVGGTAVTALEIAQVSAQHATGQRQLMLQAGEVLAVEVLELAMKVAQAQLFADGKIGAGEVEVTRLAARIAIQVQPGAIG